MQRTTTHFKLLQASPFGVDLRFYSVIVGAIGTPSDPSTNVI
jgi:hypothetical protein